MQRMDKRKHIGVVAAIICDGDRVFATQRGYGEWKDWWEFLYIISLYLLDYCFILGKGPLCG